MLRTMRSTMVWIVLLTMALLVSGLYFPTSAAAAPYVENGEGIDSGGKPLVYTWEPSTGAGYAILYGTLNDQGDSEIKHYGFYVASPGYEDQGVKIEFDGSLDEDEVFKYKLSGLDADVTYYVKAFATNNQGTGYGSIYYFEVDNTTKVSVFTIGSPNYTLWGTPKVMDVSPYVKDSRTYMPIRYVAYAMGLTDADIIWDEAAQTVLLTNSSTRVTLIIGSHNMWVNGIPTPMDVVPEITDDRTCLPIAWVAKAFGYTAVWDPTNLTVTIQSD